MRSAFDFVFSQGKPVDTPDGLAALAERLGLDPTLATAEASKVALKANTADAIAAGVFGVPSFVPYDADGAAGPVFWGVDAFDMLLAFLDEPAIFERPPFAALNHVEIGVRREKANRA